MIHVDSHEMSHKRPKHKVGSSLSVICGVFNASPISEIANDNIQKKTVDRALFMSDRTAGFIP